jgi:hypothetical protein
MNGRWAIPAGFLVLATGVIGQTEAPKTIVELQPFRESASIHIKSRQGREGMATLVNLNPGVNAWYVLKIAWNGAPDIAYHLENPDPRGRRVVLDDKFSSGITILGGKSRYSCDLLGGDPPNALDRAKASPLIFYPLCDSRLYLRNPAVGHRTTLEAATEFLRDHVWGGEGIIALGHILMGDANRNTGALESGANRTQTSGTDSPLPALIDPKYADRSLALTNLGIQLEVGAQKGLIPGAWYPARDNPGVYVSIIQPNLVDPAIFSTYKASVNSLDGVESPALVYLIAFDLDRFDLGYALGTEHPQVGWSGHVLAQVRDPKLPGPDGIGTIAPLVATGLLSPWEAPKTVATFTGGFKRLHGAFEYGELAQRNHGSHYGFMENGVVFSKLQPGLATIFVLGDGSVGMKTWAENDNAWLSKIRNARQNGVPIIEGGAPGLLVNRWGAGNWSGSEEGKLRTMRSGAMLQINGRKRFLIYAVFSDATPSAMARVFQAYRADYGLLLDMNALEHTYLASYRRAGDRMFVDHLIKGMSALDKSSSGEIIPRFLGYADNRDFFYVMRRQAP